MSPSEVPAIVSAVVRARVGRDWRRQLSRLTAGEHFGIAGILRPEVAWLLHQLGYADDVIGLALGVSRDGIVRGRRRFRGRLAGDAQLRVWFEAILPPAAKDAAVAGAA